MQAPPTRAAVGARPGKRKRGARHQRWELADVVRRYGPSYRKTHRLSRIQSRTLRAVEYCRTAALGGHLEQCTSCQRTRPVYNSCRNRHCPKCQSVAQADWREAQQALLLPIPYFHLVFTLPHDLNPLIRANQRHLYALLFRAVTDTLRTFARDPRHLGAEIGVTAVLHTWSQTLGDHIHLHCIVTGGGLTPDGSSWKPCKKPRFLFPVRALSVVFRGKFLAGLDAAYRKHHLELVGRSAPLTDPSHWQQLLAEVRAKRWHVYAKAPLAGPKQVLDYLARYTHRIAISNNRLLDIDNDTVRFGYKDYAAGAVRKEMKLQASEFLRRWLLHVLPRGFMRVRHYGLLANRHRAKKLARCRQLLDVSTPPEQSAVVEESSVARILRLTGFDASRCPFCGDGPMVRIECLVPDTS